MNVSRLYLTGTAILSMFWMCSDVSALDGPQRLDARIGRLASHAGDDYRVYELSATWRLPWKYQLSDAWFMESGLELNGGLVRRRDDDALAGGIGPVLRICPGTGRLTLDLGIRGTLLGDHELGSRDLGGAFQFTSYIGLDYRLTDHIHVAYRLQHISNAHLYRQNAGLDLQVVGLAYVF